MAEHHTVTLFRPAGQAELDLIRDSGMQAFPPRLPEQPIFYPVSNQAYAEQIARDWNTKDERSDFTGYVLMFAVEAEYLGQFPERQVGDRRGRRNLQAQNRNRRSQAERAQATGRIAFARRGGRS